MLARPFDYERAGTVEEACGLLRDHGEGAKLLAGGQSLLPMVNAGLLECDLLVDIAHVAGLSAVGDVDDLGYVSVGALVTQAELARHETLRRHQPLVGEAARHIGNSRVRNRGTLGGSLAQADPAGELPLVMTALGARVLITDGTTERDIPAEELPLSFLTTQLAPDEVVTGVRLPVLGEGWGWSFAEEARQQDDFAGAAVAVLLLTAGGSVVEARVAVGAVADCPTRLGALEAALSGAGKEDLASRLDWLAHVEPPGDSSSRSQYRRRVLPGLVLRALEEAFARSEAA